ncbi:hypothetical protein IEQ34_021451 [Dendrobium chrysotoxum]|uniref:UDP-N-acetylglucosamine 1-carboxyvinyltransferase n=1 Tax=Dendrobium chrysotoxum TaxID=161865 RepID=A0AAV7G458_DENCH|nr:hypothetical protein IEQ34_021451 [Dendrobium chrysotoxum]
MHRNPTLIVATTITSPPRLFPLIPSTFHHMATASPLLPLTFLPSKISASTSTPLRTSLPSIDHKLVISGGRPISGHVSISGSKNSALAVLAGTLCCSSGPVALRGVPDLLDTRTMADVLRSIGARVESEDRDVLVVDASDVGVTEPCSEKIGRIRAGFFVLGPLVARFGKAEVAMPGGCRIGLRPVDLYIKGLEALGAVAEEEKVCVYGANGKGLVGGSFHLAYPSVGATETFVMAASMADGVSVLTNAAMEPEVADLTKFLIACGACIEGAGTSTLVITGRKKLYGAEFTIFPDRIEAGTFMAAAAITRSCISLSPVIPPHVAQMTEKLTEAGCKITQIGPSALEVSAVPEVTGGDLQAFNIKTLPYPGFPTDLQAQCMALLTTCVGSSIIEESVFENRMHHVEELKKLGADIKVGGNTAFIGGTKPGRIALTGGRVRAADLRGGAALVLAGMAASGITEVENIAQIDRGYERFEEKLLLLGADVKRESNLHPVLLA